MGGSDKLNNRLPVFGFFSVFVQNRLGNRSAYFLVMFRSGIGSDKKITGYRFFGFFSEIVRNRLGNRSGHFLVMLRSDTGFDTDTGFRNFSG